MCPASLEEREVGSCRNLTLWCIPHTLTRGGSTVRHEKRNQGRIGQARSHFLSSFRWYMFPLQAQNVLTVPSCCRAIKSWWKLHPYTGVQGKSRIPVGSPMQIPLDNTFPRYDGAWYSQKHNMLIYHASVGKGSPSELPHLCVRSQMAFGNSSVSLLAKHPHLYSPHFPKVLTSQCPSQDSS